MQTASPHSDTLSSWKTQASAPYASHPESPAAVGKMRLSAHLVSLLLSGDPAVVNHLGGQEVELDVRVGDPRLAPDEATCFQMGCGSIP